MRASRLVLLLVALLAGGLAAFFFVSTTQTPEPQTVVQTQVVRDSMVKVLVAKTPIGVGQRLTEAALEWQDWPQGVVNPEYISDTANPDAITEMKDAVARFEFFPGEPILEKKLVRSGQGYLSAVLPQGMRGVSVQVSAASASGGFIFPNDRVDLILSRNGTGGPTAETLLENVKVLAINTRLGETGTTGAPTDPENPQADVFQSTVIATLELDPVKGEMVINATQIGTISMVLRSIADYAPKVAEGETPKTSANRPIRLIRFGKNENVMSAAGSTQVTEANYSGAESTQPPAVQ
jgi:pilus assembly protein CpaB